MVFPLDADLPLIFNTDDHAVTATWTPTGGDPTEVEGFFKDQNMMIDPYKGESVIESAEFTCAYSDMSAAVQDEPIVINSTNYKIKKIPTSQSNKIATFTLKLA